jgi:hypothetical protein
MPPLWQYFSCLLNTMPPLWQYFLRLLKADPTADNRSQVFREKTGENRLTVR